MEKDDFEAQLRKEREQARADEKARDRAVEEARNRSYDESLKGPIPLANLIKDEMRKKRP